MGKRVVLVDDSDIALEWGREALESAGCEVFTYSASLGIQAFIRQTQPDVVLLDVRMPALDGDKICKMLKNNDRTKDVKILLCSSMEESELNSKATAVGADGYIVKTSDPEKFAGYVTGHF